MRARASPYQASDAMRQTKSQSGPQNSYHVAELIVAQIIHKPLPKDDFLLEARVAVVGASWE